MKSYKSTVSTRQTTCRYTISRQEIKNCDPSRLIHDLRSSIDNKYFMAGPWGIDFVVQGYAKKPAALLDWPEFIRFVRKMDEEKPCWLYYAHPKRCWLQLMLCIGSLMPPGTVGTGALRLDNFLLDASAFVESQLADYRGMCGIVGIPDKPAYVAFSNARSALTKGGIWVGLLPP